MTWWLIIILELIGHVSGMPLPTEQSCQSVAQELRERYEQINEPIVAVCVPGSERQK